MFKQVDRQADLRAIDASVRNTFKWLWLEEKNLNGDFFCPTILERSTNLVMYSGIFRKVHKVYQAL